MNVELTGDCAGCGAPDALIYTPIYEDHPLHYCSRCQHLNDEYNRARQNLVELVRPVMGVWRAHWLGRGMEPGVLLEALENSDAIEKLLMELNTADPQNDPKHEAADLPTALQ